MSHIDHILEARGHRPWPLPAKPWRYYQEWNDTLFLHWKVPEALLQPLLPAGLIADTLDGTAWISLVAFTMQQIRPRYMPSIGPVSDFHELNLRTYVHHGGKPGVYFLSMEAGKSLSVFIARNLSGLPYVKSGMQRTTDAAGAGFHSENKSKGFLLHAGFTAGEALPNPGPLDRWLTERYCLYLDQGKKLFRFDVHHKPWPLQEVQINSLEVRYRMGTIDLYEQSPDLVRYSEGVQVVAWSKTPV